MEDTVTLARQEREKQGLWEAEVSYGGEADLHRHLIGCDKNPGHRNFIPVDQFNVDHLPSGCPDNRLVDLVRAMSDLTVRVSVKYVSDSRPEAVPGSDKPYPCYKESNGDMLRTGTGWVYGVNKYLDKYDKGYTTCKCKECVNSPTPKTQFAHINIRTAAHVVYDDLEAAHTTCHLFFDKGGTPEFCRGVVTLSCVSVVGCEQERDRCELRYVTHDLDLADKLDKIVACYRSLSESVLFVEPLPENNKSPLTTQTPFDIRLNDRVRHTLGRSPDYKRLNCRLLNKPHMSERQVIHDPRDTLTIIVSHPHGCSKQVSVGHYTGLEGRNDGSAKFTYATPTCPGSSGAHVIVASSGFLGIIIDRIHSGGQRVTGQQLNFSIY